MTKTQLRRALLATVCVVCAIATPAYATDAMTKWCEGVKIAAFPGGWRAGNGDLFSDTIYNGFRQAEADLGPNVTYNFSQWRPTQMLTDLQQAIEAKVDGVAFMGHPGDAAADPLIEKAIAQGMIVTVINVALPEAQKKYATTGTGYVGAPSYASGVALANEAAKRAGLKVGDSVFVWGDKSWGGDRAQRSIGVIDAFEKLGAKVIYQEVDPAVFSGGGSPPTDFVKIMAANPDIKIVITEGGGLTSSWWAHSCTPLRSNRAKSISPASICRPTQ